MSGDEPATQLELFKEHLAQERQNAEFNLAMASNLDITPNVRYHYYALVRLYLTRSGDFEYFGLSPETFEEFGKSIDFVPNLVRRGHAWQPTSEIFSEHLCDPGSSAFRAHRTLQRLIAANRPQQ